ncbi:MAG TPA: terminase small subunit [Patescibacteria group bacterium]|nr:terminase small subunit [Patescibacteria group bacterium]
MSHAGGAPSKLTGHVLAEAEVYIEGPDEAHIAQATLYLQNCVPKFTKRKSIAGIPTIEGLALRLDISRDTVYRWARENHQFARILDRLNLKQADQVIQEGAVGHYSPKITGVMLARHGYVEKTETEGTFSFNNEVKAKDYMRGE